jgi:hypothetical protein
MAEYIQKLPSQKDFAKKHDKRNNRKVEIRVWVRTSGLAAEATSRGFVASLGRR